MERKEQAKQLRANPLLGKLLDELKAAQVAAWESANTPEKREQCWQLVRSIEQVREHIDVRTDELARDGTRDAGDGAANE
jgi:hypothetical protein